MNSWAPGPAKPRDPGRHPGTRARGPAGGQRGPRVPGRLRGVAASPGRRRRRPGNPGQGDSELLGPARSRPVRGLAGPHHRRRALDSRRAETRRDHGEQAAADPPAALTAEDLASSGRQKTRLVLRSTASPRDCGSSWFWPLSRATTSLPIPFGNSFQYRDQHRLSGRRPRERALPDRGQRGAVLRDHHCGEANHGHGRRTVLRTLKTSFNALVRDGQTATHVVATDPVSGETVGLSSARPSCTNQRLLLVAALL